jgi:hypothetical protein
MFQSFPAVATISLPQCLYPARGQFPWAAPHLTETKKGNRHATAIVCLK